MKGDASSARSHPTFANKLPATGDASAEALTLLPLLPTDFTPVRIVKEADSREQRHVLKAPHPGPPQALVRPS